MRALDELRAAAAAGGGVGGTGGGRLVRRVAQKVADGERRVGGDGLVRRLRIAAAFSGPIVLERFEGGVGVGRGDERARELILRAIVREGGEEDGREDGGDRVELEQALAQHAAHRLQAFGVLVGPRADQPTRRQPAEASVVASFEERRRLRRLVRRVAGRAASPAAAAAGRRASKKTEIISEEMPPRSTPDSPTNRTSGRFEDRRPD